MPFVGFTYSGEISSASENGKIIRPIRTVSATTKPNFPNKFSPGPDELDRLRQLYERNRSQLMEQTHQMQELKEHHDEQTANTRQEQIDYLIRLLNSLPNPPSLNRQTISLENIRTQLEEQLYSFLTIHKRLSTKSSKDKSKTISHDLSIVLSKYSQDFSRLFNQTETDTEVFHRDQDNQTTLSQLTLFLNELYANVNKILQEKQSIEEKLNSRSSIPEPPSGKSMVRTLSFVFLLIKTIFFSSVRSL